MKEKNCPIDGEKMTPIFQCEILNKYSIQYYSCPKCFFLQTESPFWLDEAYEKAIVDIDTGIMERNIHNSLRVSACLYLLGCKKEEVIVDLAGGYGLLTRMLRDIGFNCWWSDKYCTNIVAKGFNITPNKKVKILCALEVLEHLENPITFLKNAIVEHNAEGIVFSTEEFKTIPNPDWPYYSRDSGQHISFYSTSSLQMIAKTLNWHYIPLPRHLHLLTKKTITKGQRILLKTYLLYLYGLWAIFRMRKYSRTHTDQIFFKKKQQ